MSISSSASGFSAIATSQFYGSIITALTVIIGTVWANVVQAIINRIYPPDSGKRDYIYHQLIYAAILTISLCIILYFIYRIQNAHIFRYLKHEVDNSSANAGVNGTNGKENYAYEMVQQIVPPMEDHRVRNDFGDDPRLRSPNNTDPRIRQEEGTTSLDNIL